MECKMTPSDRRDAILDMLCRNEQVTAVNLAFHFSVSRGTIMRDIEILTASHPIETSRGNGGGIYVPYGYTAGRKYLNAEQKKTLEVLSGQLTGKEGLILESILRDFALKY